MMTSEAFPILLDIAIFLHHASQVDNVSTSFVYFPFIFTAVFPLHFSRVPGRPRVHVAEGVAGSNVQEGGLPVGATYSRALFLAPPR